MDLLKSQPTLGVLPSGHSSSAPGRLRTLKITDETSLAICKSASSLGCVHIQMHGNSVSGREVDFDRGIVKVWKNYLRELQSLVDEQSAHIFLLFQTASSALVIKYMPDSCSVSSRMRFASAILALNEELPKIIPNVALEQYNVSAPEELDYQSYCDKKNIRTNVSGLDQLKNTSDDIPSSFKPTQADENCRLNRSQLRNLVSDAFTRNASLSKLKLENKGSQTFQNSPIEHKSSASNESAMLEQNQLLLSRPMLTKSNRARHKPLKTISQLTEASFEKRSRNFVSKERNDISVKAEQRNQIAIGTVNHEASDNQQMSSSIAWKSRSTVPEPSKLGQTDLHKQESSIKNTAQLMHSADSKVVDSIVNHNFAKHGVVDSSTSNIPHFEDGDTGGVLGISTKTPIVLRRQEDEKVTNELGLNSSEKDIRPKGTFRSLFSYKSLAEKNSDPVKLEGIGTKAYNDTKKGGKGVGDPNNFASVRKEADSVGNSAKIDSAGTHREQIVELFDRQQTSSKPNSSDTGCSIGSSATNSIKDVSLAKNKQTVSIAQSYLHSLAKKRSETEEGAVAKPGVVLSNTEIIKEVSPNLDQADLENDSKRLTTTTKSPQIDDLKTLESAAKPNSLRSRHNESAFADAAISLRNDHSTGNGSFGIMSNQTMDFSVSNASTKTTESVAAKSADEVLSAERSFKSRFKRRAKEHKQNSLLGNRFDSCGSAGETSKDENVPSNNSLTSDHHEKELKPEKISDGESGNQLESIVKEPIATSKSPELTASKSTVNVSFPSVTQKPAPAVQTFSSTTIKEQNVAKITTKIDWNNCESLSTRRTARSRFRGADTKTSSTKSPNIDAGFVPVESVSALPDPESIDNLKKKTEILKLPIQVSTIQVKDSVTVEDSVTGEAQENIIQEAVNQKTKPKSSSFTQTNRLEPVEAKEPEVKSVPASWRDMVKKKSSNCPPNPETPFGADSQTAKNPVLQSWPSRKSSSSEKKSKHEIQSYHKMGRSLSGSSESKSPGKDEYRLSECRQMVQSGIFPEGVRPRDLVDYLRKDDFVHAFNMTMEEFLECPVWKKTLMMINARIL